MFILSKIRTVYYYNNLVVNKVGMLEELLWSLFADEIILKMSKHKSISSLTAFNLFKKLMQ